MAFITDHITSPAFVNLRGLFEGLKNAFDFAASSRSRMDQMERLSAKTDAELEELGIRRDEIARYVFRDILYL